MMISTRACKWDQFWKIMKVLRLGVQHAKYNLKILHRTVTKLFHTELFDYYPVVVYGTWKFKALKMGKVFCAATR